MYAFSKNGKPTIVPKKPGVTIGQRQGFSSIDIYKINKFYGCEMEEEILQNMPSVIKVKGTNSSLREAWLEMPETYSQDCKSGQSRLVYYEAVSEPLPGKVFEASLRNERKIAFTIESYAISDVNGRKKRSAAREDHYDCKHFCLCAFNTNGGLGICYVPVQTNNFYINFISNCQGDACYIYAAIYDKSHGYRRPGFMEEGTNKPFVSPNPYHVPVGPNSGYLKNML
uniref:Peptidase M12A domain-containing protein n=1 Tax=Acrobeloides nanus TaxID=290746 RepID=A0A914DRM7_9BILA